MFTFSILTKMHCVYPTIDMMCDFLPHSSLKLCQPSFLIYVKFNTVYTPVQSLLLPCLDWHAAAYICCCVLHFEKCITCCVMRTQECMWD